LITGERLGPKQWNYWNVWNDWNQWKIQRSFTLNLEPIRQAQGKLFQASGHHEDVGPSAQKFKKSYIEEKYGVGEAEIRRVDKLMQQLFVRQK
jgi:hypothetical protein